MEDYNRQYFSKEDIKAGLHVKFIQFLLDNFETDEYRVDMHVYHEDCGAIVVEWNRQLWDYIDEMGKFAFVGANECVMQEVEFPDGHYDYACSDEEAKEMLASWRRAQKNNKEVE